MVVAPEEIETVRGGVRATLRACMWLVYGEQKSQNKGLPYLRGHRRQEGARRRSVSRLDRPGGAEHLPRSAPGLYGDVRLGGVHHDGGLEATPGGGSDGLELVGI